MTPEGWRCLTLVMVEECGVGHTSHPDLRVGGKGVATVSYADEGLGTLARNRLEPLRVPFLAPARARRSELR